MSSTYLSLVTDFVRETGYSGGTAPDDVATATGDQAKAVYWINQASLQIQREWINWSFLWRFAEVNLTQGGYVVPSAYETQAGTIVALDVVNMVQRKTLAIMQSDGSAHFPEYVDWGLSDFMQNYVYETPPETDTPAFWSRSPQGVISLSAPIDSDGLVAKYQYYRKPKELINSADVPLIPLDFTRLIVVAAKIMYAEHEDAPEVSAGAHEEYDFLLSEMQTVYLPDQSHHRESHSDADLVVVSE
jgi:hypothetical protein